MSGRARQWRILFVHPDLYAYGGAEKVCVQMMAAAQRLGNVTLVHCGGSLDAESIWKWFGISLDPNRVKFVTAGRMGAVLGHAAAKPIAKYAVALRYAARIVSDFDLVVGSYGECPIPAKRGVQYIHVPIFSMAAEISRYLNAEGHGSLRGRLRTNYVRVSRWLSNWDVKQVTRKSTLVNSQWTAEVVRRIYSISSIVTPPSVDVSLKPGGQGWVDWAERATDFVMLSRIHPAKRLELGIEIVERLRRKGHAVQLHIVGRGAGNYFKQFRRSIAAMPYVHLHLDLPRTELERLVVRQRFGLHACEYEHYGIAAAEMQALGCVVFVPDFAGQREVVKNPDQRYVDVDDAVTKICLLLGQPIPCGHISAEAARMFKARRGEAFEERVEAFFEESLAN